MTIPKRTITIGGTEDINNMKFRYDRKGKRYHAETGTVTRSWTDTTSPAVMAEIIKATSGFYIFRYFINTYDGDWVTSYGHYVTATEAISDCKEAIIDELETLIR